MKRNPHEAAQHGEITQPSEWCLPQPHCPRNGRVGWQTAVRLRIGRIMQNVDHPGASHARRIVNARILEAVVLAKLTGPLLGEILHVVLGAKMQASRGARLDAGGFETLAHAVRAQSTLVDLLGSGIEFRNVEGTSGDAVSAADAAVLLEINDAVRVLHDGAVGGTGREASRVGAMHALILTHQPHHRSVFLGLLVELDQVPEIPLRGGHRLVSVVKSRLRVRKVVRFLAVNLAGLAVDACGSVNKFADLVLTLHPFARYGSRRAADFMNME